MAHSQKQISRVRPPRVQITCDVDGAEGQKKMEIPFVIGVMAGLSGKSFKDKIDLRKRRFIECNSDEELDAVMERLAPRAAFEVNNTLGGGGKLQVDITFESMKDFSPEKVASQIDGLKQKLELRNKLAALAARTDGKYSTEKWLKERLAAIKQSATPPSA